MPDSSPHSERSGMYLGRPPEYWLGLQEQYEDYVRLAEEQRDKWRARMNDLEEQFDALRDAVTAYLKDLDEDGVGDLDMLLDLIESNPASGSD